MVTRSASWVVWLAVGSGLLGCAELAGINAGTLRDDSASVAGTGGGGGTGGTGTGGAGGQGGAGGALIRPPEKPDAASQPGTARSVAFAPRRYFFGRTDPEDCNDDSCPIDTSGWERIGFDIDGRTTTQALARSDSPGTCQRALGAPLNVLTDGDGGRDNTFGGAMYPLMDSFAVGGSIEEQIAKSIARGHGSNLVLVLEDLGDGPDDPSVQAALYNTAPDLVEPVWDGTHLYQVDAKSVNGNTVTQPRVRFLNGYLKGHVFVSGTFNDASDAPNAYLPLPGASSFAVLAPEAVTWVVELSPDHTKAVRAVVSLVVNPAHLAEAFRPLLLQFVTCDEGQAENIIKGVYKFADLSAGEPDFLDLTGASVCNRMSVAFAMDLQPVAIPADPVAYPEDPPSPCDGEGGNGGTGGEAAGGGGTGGDA